MNPELLTGLLVALVGLLGGFVNAVLSGPLRLPGRVTLPDSRIGYDLGWVGNVLLGGVAAILVWGFDLTNPEAPQVYITALLAGIGGARVINDFLERKNLQSSATALAKELAETIKEPEGNNSE